MDIKFDSDNKLLFINGDFVRTVDHLDSVAQSISVRLKTTLGKWFWDENYGVDWFGKVFGKSPNKTRIDLLLQDTINKEKYVERITQFTSNIESTTRTYHCEFKAKIAGITKVETFYVITDQNGFLITTDSNRSLITM